MTKTWRKRPGERRVSVDISKIIKCISFHFYLGGGGQEDLCTAVKMLYCSMTRGPERQMFIPIYTFICIK